MPLRLLSPEEIEAFLAHQRVVRVAFGGRTEGYLVPLGYVWLDGALCGSMTAGRKTVLARADPRVTFQVDDVCDVGPWRWTSVTGRGRVEFLDEPESVESVRRGLDARWPDVPDWLAAEVEERRAAGQVFWYRIRPNHLEGCRSVPPGG